MSNFKQKPRENCVKNCTKHVKEDCKCDLGVACECLFPPLRRDQVAMKLLDEPTIIEAPLLVEEEHVSLVEEEQVELTYESNPKISSSIYDEASRSMSSFAPSDSSSNDEREGMKCVLSEGFSKLQSKKKQESLPKLNVTHPTRAVSVSTLMELPEIRTPVRTDYRSVEPEIKPKKKFG